MGRWRVAVVAVAAVFVALSVLATWDVLSAARAPLDVARAPGSVATEQDDRRQVNVRIVFSSDAPYTYGFRRFDDDDDDGTTSTSNGGETVIDRVFRGRGPYVQATAQTSAGGTSVGCRVEINGEVVNDERERGGFAVVFCAG